MKKEELPIISKCGTEIKVGDICYIVSEKRMLSHAYHSKKELKETAILTRSGDSRAFIEKYEVIKVNRSLAQRSFIIRSEKGCEETYTVKGQCLPENLFFNFKNAKKLSRDMDKRDIEEIKNKIKQKQNRIIKIKEDLDEWKECLKILKDSLCAK